MNKRYIYGLVDPRTNEVRYVGQTNDYTRRIREHIKRAKLKSTYKNNWIKELLSLKLSPEVTILEECNFANIVEREAYWITQFENLTNILTSGISYAGHSEAIKEKIRKTGSEHSQYGKPKSQETKDKISNTLKGRPINKHTLKKITEAAQKQGGNYLVTSPTGEVHKIHNLSKFCRENKLSQGHLSSVASGKRKQHKGWVAIKDE